MESRAPRFFFVAHRCFFVSLTYLAFSHQASTGVVGVEASTETEGGDFWGCCPVRNQIYTLRKTKQLQLETQIKHHFFQALVMPSSGVTIHESYFLIPGVNCT